MTTPTNAPSEDIRARIKTAPMSSFQIRTVAICFILNMIDGFDVLVMPFAAPSVARHWAVGDVMLGYMLSASLFGMAFGAFFIAPLADRIGRRQLTIWSLVVACAALVASVFSPTAWFLLLMRVIAGVGIGGMISNMAVLVNEYSNGPRRALAVGVYTTGYPIGATVGGLIAGPLIQEFGWRASFGLAAGMTLVITIVTIAALPESYEYLIARQTHGALDKLNAIIGKMGHAPIDEMPRPRTQPGAEKSGVFREVFGSEKLAQTLLTWVGYALLTAALYFANSWLTKLIAQQSGSDALGLISNILFNAGGAVGAAIFGLLAARSSSRNLLTASMVMAAACYLGFGFTINYNVYVAMAFGFLGGFAVIAGMTGVYSIGPALYSTTARGSGFGWIMGIGRLTSIIAPILVGYLLAAEIPPERTFQIFAVPLLVSAAAWVALGAVRRAKGLNPEPSVADHH